MAESEWLSRSVWPTEAPLCQRPLSFELATLVRCPKSTSGLDQSNGRSTPISGGVKSYHSLKGL